jgi:hypothetical protein
LFAQQLRYSKPTMRAAALAAGTSLEVVDPLRGSVLYRTP